MGKIALRPQNAQGMFSNVVLQIRKVRLLYCMHTTTQQQAAYDKKTREDYKRTYFSLYS